MTYSKFSPGYLFISNGTRPSEDEFNSLDPINPRSFSIAAITAANDLGWKIHMGVNRKHPELIISNKFNIRFYNQNLFRSIWAFRDNLKAYRNLCRYLEENPDIKIIHCNTPIGGTIGRLVGKKYNKKVVYTAHGFHFYKGAPFINRIVLKWIEKWLAHFTDIIITINSEDFDNAQGFKLKAGGKIYLIPGVGIDLSQFNHSMQDTDKRAELGLKKSDKLIITIGDLNRNKNQGTLIKALQYLPEDYHILICGEGPLRSKLENLAVKLDIYNRCHFLGYRSDVISLLEISDIFVMASKREGLPRSTMEAMAAGLPCIVSDIRGNRDLIEDGKGGYLVSTSSAKGFADAILRTISMNQGSLFSHYNMKKIKEFELNIVKDKMLGIFKDIGL